MSCSILRNKEGVVETVLAPNGKTSKLYQDALVVIKDKEKALRLWATGYTPSFNKWMSNLKPYNRFVPYKSTSNLETFLDENGEPKLSTISSYVISNKKNSEPGVINNNSRVTFTTDNPLFNKCAQ